MPEVAALTRNVVYDTAASTYLYRPEVFRTVLDLVGPERVLWGSDHPVLGMRRFLKRTLGSAGLRSDELEPVLAGNARRVYRMNHTDRGNSNMELSE
jgi:predicted TIM-barrel fold metal-dependent hydrolase